MVIGCRRLADVRTVVSWRWRFAKALAFHLGGLSLRSAISKVAVTRSPRNSRTTYHGWPMGAD